MANRHRGEIAARFNDKTYTLCLTLGALAELEEVFNTDSMLEIVERFENGRLRSNDAIAILTAAMRAAGTDVNQEDVARMQVEGGAKAYLEIVADLLNVTFNATPKPNDPSS